MPIVPIWNNHLANKFTEEYLQLEQTIKALTERQMLLKDALMRSMERNGLVSVENEMLKIKYIQPTTQERFDAKAFRAEHEDLYNEYVKFVEVKPQLRITRK